MPESHGTVLAVDPPRNLAFDWGGDEIRFDLEDAGPDGTRFTLTHVLGEENTAARNSAGWEVCLSALDAKARGERFQGPHAGVTTPWKEYYQGYLDAGLPSGAPIPGA